MSDLIREEFEKNYKSPLGCYWNSMTGEYGQSWDELMGDDDLDKEIRIHNDRFLVWQASREFLVIELPERGPSFTVAGVTCFSLKNEGRNEAIKEIEMSIHAAGVKTK